MSAAAPHGPTYFRHIVLLHFTPSSSVAQHQAVAEALRGLPDVIEEIRSYDVNLDAGLSPDNAHVSVIGDFADEAAWRAYSQHPAHLAIVNQRIAPILESASRTQIRPTT